MVVDVGQLESLLMRRLGRPGFRLTALSVKCAWPVFRGESAGWPPVFVKVATDEGARRTLDFLQVAADCDFLPRPVLDAPIPFAGYSVLCLRWMDATWCFPEDMSDAQADSFLDGCVRLSQILAKARDVSDLPSEEDPERLYGAVSGYVCRHPFLGRLLKGLTDIPVGDRTFGSRSPVPIHGDLQPKNYGFAGDRFAAVFDFDDLTRGLACEDAAYAFAERARRSELSDSKRNRLTEIFFRLVERSPWPCEDWLFALNHCRLRIAYRRLKNHPDAPFVAFDIARRDRPLRQLVSALTGRFGRGTATGARKV